MLATSDSHASWKPQKLPMAAAHPGVITAFRRDGARKLADHVSGGKAPEQRSKQQNEYALGVTGAMHDVFCAVSSAGNHKEGGGDERPERQLC